MNGPADNYISACASCHSTATRDPMKETISILPPTDKDVMIYFRNVRGGTPFDENLNPDDPKSKTKSADYSLQLQMGYSLYNKWRDDTESAAKSMLRKTRYVWTGETNPADASQRYTLRQGPELEFEKNKRE